MGRGCRYWRGSLGSGDGLDDAGGAAGGTVRLSGHEATTQETQGRLVWVLAGPVASL